MPPTVKRLLPSILHYASQTYPEARLLTVAPVRLTTDVNCTSSMLEQNLELDVEISLLGSRILSSLTLKMLLPYMRDSLCFNTVQLSSSHPSDKTAGQDRGHSLRPQVCGILGILKDDREVQMNFCLLFPFIYLFILF